MQTQKEFTKNIAEEIEKIMGSYYKVKIFNTEKINIGRLHALVISKDGINISQNFYIEELYKDYQHGGITISEIAKRVVSSCYNSADSINELIGFGRCMNNKEWVEERLFLQLINSSKNKSLLEDSVHIDFDSLSLILYILLEDTKTSIYKIRVTKELCQNFNWDEKEIMNYALENTVKLFPYHISTINEILQKALNTTDEEIVEAIPNEENMMVLTNERQSNGAITIFYPGVLKEISEKHDTNLFLMPSSIHEFIILEDNGIYNPVCLESMITEINNTDVLPEELLSDNVYYYNRNTNMFSVFNNGRFEEICKL